MAKKYKFSIEYDEKKQIARVTNEPLADGYVCGYDIVFNSPKDKRDLKEALTQIIVQCEKPKAARGKEDRTPVTVLADLKRAEELEVELAAVKAELEALKPVVMENPNAGS